MKRNPALRLSAAAIALMLAACGQKGPLYLPGDPSEIQTEIPPEPAAPDSGDGPVEAEPGDDDQ